MTGSRFLLTLFTRIVILALAAVSLNLILGYGGMMSFGHAAYLGIGGYAVGILAFEGSRQALCNGRSRFWCQRFSHSCIGALSLRTRGVYFIMITLAFAQMAYYIVAGLARYGGDDGLTIQKRSQFLPPINLSNKVQFYYICLVLLCARSTWCGAWSTPVLAWQCRVRDRTICACARSVFRPIVTNSPALSLPERCVVLPARCLPITPISSARQ